METQTETLSPPFHSPEQVARKLNLHVRTVRNYVRQGRLKAARIGKQYRIADADLRAFVQPDASAEVDVRADRAPAAVPARAVDASSIVQIDAIDRAAADRVTNTVLAALKGRDPDRPPLRVDSIYDPDHARLKVILTGDLRSAATTLSLIAALAEGDS
jgi:excisionase family DNA binding protein